MASSDTDEVYQRESKAFLTKLFNFHERRGTPIKRIPLLGGRELDLYHLYKKVASLGGSEVVTRCRLWGEVARSFNLPPSVTSASYAIRQHFTKLLENYEAVEKGYALPPIPQPQPILPPTIYRPVLPQPPPPTMHHFPSLTVAQKQKDEEKTVKCDRIVRSLMSGLPNEVDFAFNVLTIMSHSVPRDLPIEKMPNLLNVMLAHVAIFSDDDWGLEAVYHESWYRDSEPNFLEFWELAVPEWVYGSVLSSTFSKASYHSSLFASRSPLVEGEGVEGYRVSQVLTILQNLSFEENSQQFLAQHTGVRRLLLLCSNSHLLSIRSCALDTLSNLASALLLSHEPFSTTDLLLATVHQCILSEDKLCIVRGLEVLGELAWCLHNEPSLNSTPMEVYHRMFHMLILPDCELVVASLEALYNLSFYGADIADSIVQVNNSIEVLVHLLTLKVESFGEEVLEQTMLVVPNPQLSQLSSLLTNQIQARTNLNSGMTSSTTNQNSASNNTPVIVLPGGVQVSNVGMATGLKTASLQQLTNQIQPRTSGSQPLTISNLPLKLNQNLLTQKNSFSTVLTGKQVQDLIAQLRPPAPTPTPSPSTHTPSTTTLSTRSTNINLTIPTPPLRVQSSSLAVPGGVNTLGPPKAGMQGDEFAQRWLRMCYEEAPSNYVPRVEMYTLYILYCSEMGQTNIVNSNDFNNIIRRVFPNSLFTRVTVNNHTVHMIAGLRKLKISPQDNALLTQTGEPNNTPAPIKLVSIPGTSTLVATVGKGVTSGSASKLHAPGSLQLPSNKVNFGVHSPLAITNKASGVLRLNSALSRPLAPAAVTLTNQIAPLGHMTTTALTGRSNLNSNERRSSSPKPSSNMATTSTLQLVSTPPLNATPLLPTLANASATQGSITGRSSPNLITAQTSTRPSSPASSTLSLSSVCPISRASSPAVQPQGANSRPSTPALSVSSIAESENSTLSPSLSGPGINPQVVPPVGSVTLAGLSNSRSRSTSPASVISSDGNQKTLGLCREDAGQLSSGLPIRLVDGHVGINYGMIAQEGRKLVSKAHVGENEKLLEPEPKRNKLDTTLVDSDTKLQAVNTERIHLGVQSDLTRRAATFSQSGMAVESTITLSLTTPATADVHTTTTTDNTCTTASSQTSKTGFGVSDQHVVTHPQTSTVVSNNASQVDVTRRLNTTTTHPTLPTPHLPTTNATMSSSFISSLPSSGHLNTILPLHHPSLSTTNATATSSTLHTTHDPSTAKLNATTVPTTLHTTHDPSTAKLNATTVPTTLHTPHDSSSTAAKLNATTTLPIFHNPHDSSLVMTSKPLSVCTNGSQTDVTATVMAVNHTSQLMTSSSTCSGTSADNDGSVTVPRPLSSGSGETLCVCAWDNCTRSHSSWENLFYHVVYDHLSTVTTFPCACRWQACPSQVKRMRPSMLRHIQTHHCSVGPKPSPPSVPTTLAKLKALPELERERESLLTKAVRLTAGLVLRNLIRTVPEARRRLVRWELLLCQIALSTSEASTAVSQCLYLLHHPPTTSMDTGDIDSEMPYHASNLL